jgi:hypothetical protein
MTYRQLQTFLNTMSDEELDCEVSVEMKHSSGGGETSFSVGFEIPIHEDGSPYLIIEED